MLKRNKKGSVTDLIMVGGIILFFGMIMLIGYKISDEFNTKIQAHDTVDPMGKTSSNRLVSYYPGVIDNSFLLLTIGLCIIALVLAVLVRVHPVFLALYILALAFVIFFCGIFSNIYQEMAANSELTALADNLIFISTVLTYLPLIIGVIGSLLAIIMYKSWQQAQ